MVVIFFIVNEENCLVRQFAMVVEIALSKINWLPRFPTVPVSLARPCDNIIYLKKLLNIHKMVFTLKGYKIDKVADMFATANHFSVKRNCLL